MATRTLKRPARVPVFLLDRGTHRTAHFLSLRPEIVSSAASLRDSLGKATKDSLWIIYEPSLTASLLKALPLRSASLGGALILHPIKLENLPALTTWFRRIAFSTSGAFLPPDELAEALDAENRAELFLGGSIDRDSKTITLWRGNLEPLTVPFAAFETSGDGIEPDFEKLSVTDHGQTIRLGEYEAASDAILYESDPDYRRHVAKQRRQSERSFGASLRRLRNQRGLAREDFGPDVAAKTIARIERGKVQRIRAKTLKVIAEKLSVDPDDIETY